MRKDCFFPDFDGSSWPSPNDLRGDFFKSRGGNLISRGGNDGWGLEVQGLFGTEFLPKRQSVNVNLRLTANPDYGVTLQYDKWDGRIQRKDSYNSKGDLSRLKKFVRSLHGDPLSIGLFIPFASAWDAVNEFMQTDGALPTSIEWIASRDLPPETFPEPWVNVEQ